MSKSILQAIKEAHPYQLKILAFSCLLMMIPNALMMCLPLLLIEPVTFCYPKTDDLTLPIEPFECTLTQACSGEYNFYIDQTHSIQSLVTNFRLVCEDQYEADLVGSSSFLGNLLGCLHAAFIDLSKPLAKPLWLASLGCAIISLIGIFSFTIEIFWAVIFGLYYLSAIVSTYIYSHTVEVCRKDPVLKDVCIQFVYFGWAMSSVYGGLLALISADWKIMLGLYTGLPILIICIAYMNLGKEHEQFIEDDAKVPYLEDQSEAKKIFSNSLPLMNDSDHETTVSESEDIEADDSHKILKKVKGNSNLLEYKQGSKPIQSEPNIRDLLKNPRLRNLVTIFSALEIVGSIVYYGAHIAIFELVGSLYLNLILIGVVESTADLLTAAINRRFQRKPTLYVLFGLNFIVFASFIFIGPKSVYNDEDEDKTMQIGIISTFLIIFGKWLNTTAYSTYHTYMAELVPDTHLTAFFGMVSFNGAIFLVAVPQLITFVQSIGMSVYVVFGLCNLIAMVIVVPLPETKKESELLVDFEQKEKEQEMQFGVLKEEDNSEERVTL